MFQNSCTLTIHLRIASLVLYTQSEYLKWLGNEKLFFLVHAWFCISKHEQVTDYLNVVSTPNGIVNAQIKTES